MDQFRAHRGPLLGGRSPGRIVAMNDRGVTIDEPTLNLRHTNVPYAAIDLKTPPARSDVEVMASPAPRLSAKPPQVKFKAGDRVTFNDRDNLPVTGHGQSRQSKERVGDPGQQGRPMARLGRTLATSSKSDTAAAPAAILSPSDNPSRQEWGLDDAYDREAQDTYPRIAESQRH